MLTERHSSIIALLVFQSVATLGACSGSDGDAASQAAGTPTSGGPSATNDGAATATNTAATGQASATTSQTTAATGTSGGTEVTGSGGGTTTTAAATTSQGGATSGDTTGETGGGATTAGIAVDVTIEPNPNSVLSAYVSWTTPEPASSVVQFGAGELTWEIEGDANVTDHRVLVIGMRAETEYLIRALSTGPSNSFQGDGTFTTGPLPSQIPVATISVHDVERTQPGWTLMNVQKGDGTNRALSGAPPAAVIYDEAGHPVWYWINGTQNERGGAISVDPTDVGVLMGPSETTAPKEVDWAGNEVWACADLRCGGTSNLSHHSGKLSNGNYVVMRDAMNGGRISQIFEEHTAAGAGPIHSVGVEDAVTPPGGASGDWAHGNSITIDLENDVAYMSFRWLGLIKMQYSTRTMLWHLPASYGAQGMGDMTFVPADSQFSDIHDPEIHDDGTILFFDNGGYTGVIEDGNPANLHTRAVEYMIDETAKTATLVWEWPGNFETDPWYKEQLYVPFWGDADRLANGNVLIAAGRRGTVEITPESRVIEVTKDTGEVAWELRLPKDHGVYRAERLYPLPLVRPIQ